MQKCLWVSFYCVDSRGRSRLLTRYTLKDEFPGERKETKNLLAEENRISPDDIIVKLEWK